MSATRLAVILLAAATAVIHFALMFPNIPFIMNGLGYVVLVGALYLPIPQLEGRSRLVRRALIGYTALTIAMWVAFGARTPIGFIDKAIELALVGVLVWDDRRQGGAT